MAQEIVETGLQRPRSHRRDRGTTFIEILVVIVLLGIATVAILTAVRTTVIATSVERDHAKAQQWLQSAIGVIESEDFAPCTAAINGTAVRTKYQTAVDDPTTGAKKPFGFDGSIVVSIPEVWTGANFVAFNSQTQCYDQQSRNRQQRILVTATEVDGVTESVEMIKVDR